MIDYISQTALLCACLHHLTKLHIENAWQKIKNERTIDPEPEDVLFKKFQTEWESWIEIQVI